jgi:hypothetical protein
MIRSRRRPLADGLAWHGRVGWSSGLPLLFGLLLAGLLGLLLTALVLLGGAPSVEHLHLLAPMRWGEVALLA